MVRLDKWEKIHRQNVASYERQIDRIFQSAAAEAAAISLLLGNIKPDKPFSFTDYPVTRKKVEKLLSGLKTDITAIIVDGIESEWTLSNNKNSELANQVFGDNAKNLTEEQSRKYYSTNDKARQAFIDRKTAGLNLSDRVWRYTKQFKTEIEMGLDIGIRDGLSADELSRELRQYLRHPDKLFRRVRDEHGVLQLSKAARAFHPGQGVYRSSYKNARRLAATETNIAYRTADFVRWKQLDFVVGIEIRLSNNHTLNGVPFEDICDYLKGKYPKDFKFVGWHPLCRCHVVTILKTPEEMAEDNRRIINGEPPLKGSVNAIKDVPANFRQWIEEHSEKIEKGGKLPYFIADNRKRVDRILGIATEPKKTPIEIAQERHEARTTKQAMAIQQAWNESRIRSIEEYIRNGLLPEDSRGTLKQMLSINSPEHFEEIKARIATLQKVARRHAARSEKTVSDIKERWAKKQKRDATTRLMANNVLKAAQNWQEVDFSTLQKIISDNNLGAMRAEAKKVAQAIKAMRDEEKALADLIPNVHEWHKQFSLADLRSVHSNVTRTFKSKGWSLDIEDATGLEKLRKGLIHEVDWMGTKGKTRYATWEVSQAAYKEKLAWAEKRIEMLGQKTAIADEIKLLQNSRSTVGKQLVADFEKMFKEDTTDIATLKFKAADIKAKAKQLEKTRAKAKATPTPTTASIPFGGMTDEEAKKALIDFANKIGTRIDPSKIVVDNGFIHLQGDQQMCLYNALRAETPAEHKQLWTHNGGGGAHFGMGGYVRTGNSFQINSAFRKNGIFGDIDSANEALLRKAGMTPDDLKTIRLLDKKIAEFSMPVPILATRYVDLNALTNIFGQPVKGRGLGTTSPSLESWKEAVKKLPTKNMQVDPAFLSASLNETQNVFYRNYKVKLQIEIPPETPMYLTDNYPESEVVLGRGTQLEFLGVSIQTINRNFGWAGDQQYHHVTIRCRIKR